MGSRLSSFYERAGMVKCLGNPERKGSVTVAGAVSPPGADFSEPVTQNTLRIIDALYALDVSLANKRHFPAINWLTSYSLYVDVVKDWWNEHDPGWEDTRAKALRVLQLYPKETNYCFLPPG
jgi:V/A-type H+-transporting ATPase subunit A